ncbi:MAG: metal ABC transporter ATP-binding protein [Parachlamydiaceae bacterium]
MTKAIEFDHVYFSYQDLCALSNITFAISIGEFVSIIGPNGGGKTTLLKLMMGFLKPSSGRVTILNQPPEKALQTIAYVPQNLRYDREFPISVKELVLSGRLSHLSWYGQFRPSDYLAVKQSLEQVGIAHLQESAFGALSGGQQQRALIARALASQPEILLLDEPTANVDAEAQAEIYALLYRLKRTMTILIVTHDLKMAIEQVDRVLCVEKQLISYSPQEVCEHYAMGLYHPRLISLELNRGKK